MRHVVILCVLAYLTVIVSGDERVGHMVVANGNDLQQHQIVSLIQEKATQHGLEADASRYPHIFLYGNNDEKVASVCSTVSSSNVNVQCNALVQPVSFASLKETTQAAVGADVKQIVQGKVVQGAPPASYTYILYNCARNDGKKKLYPSCRQMARYQVILWFSLAIAFLTLLAFGSFLWMPIKKDPLLFGNLNPTMGKRPGM